MDGTLIATMIVSCLLGGLLKGISGSGLPAVVVPIIALQSDVPTAVAIAQFPSVFINIAQARPRNQPASAVLVHWPIAATLFVAAVIGVSLLRVTPPAALLLIVAGLTLAAALFLFLVPTFSLPSHLRLRVGIPVSLAAGISAGMSSLAGPILVPYLLSLRLPKDLYVPVVSSCYLATIVPTVGAFLYWNVVDPRLFALSGLAVIPALAGMKLGNRLRDKIDEMLFSYVVLAVLAGSAIMLIGKALTS